MILLQYGDKTYPIGSDQLVIGSGDGCSIRLEGHGVAPRHAAVKSTGEGSPAVWLLSDAEAKVNGVRLGADPTPLLHGDKLELGGHELVVVDEDRSGSTQHVDVSGLAALGDAAGAGDQPAARDGRLVCLTDGREYPVPDDGLTFGREAGSDVVVSGDDVSREHATISLAGAGYTIADSSTNGTWVNGELLTAPRILDDADVIKIGPDEFRFYATILQSKAHQDTGSGRSEAPPPPPTLPPGARARLNNTMMGLPAVDMADLRRAAQAGPEGQVVPLATLLIRNGRNKGDRLEIKVPVANIGRADYNDVVVDDESVSLAHGKLQRRDDIWVFSDLGSTNGSMVDGVPVEDEVALSPGATIQLGEVKLLFDPADEMGAGYPPGTKVVPALPSSPGPPARMRGHKSGEPIEARPRPKQLVGKARSGRPKWIWPVIIVTALAAAAYFLFLR